MYGRSMQGVAEATRYYLDRIDPYDDACILGLICLLAYLLTTYETNVTSSIIVGMNKMIPVYPGTICMIDTTYKQMKSFLVYVGKLSLTLIVMIKVKHLLWTKQNGMDPLSP